MKGRGDKKTRKEPFRFIVWEKKSLVPHLRSKWGTSDLCRLDLQAGNRRILSVD